MKKIFAMLMLVSVIGMVAAGCSSGGGDADAAKPETPAAGSETKTGS